MGGPRPAMWGVPGHSHSHRQGLQRDISCRRPPERSGGTGPRISPIPGSVSPTRARGDRAFRSEVYVERSDLPIAAGSVLMLYRVARQFPLSLGDIPFALDLESHSHRVVNTWRPQPAHLFQNKLVVAPRWRI